MIHPKTLKYHKLSSRYVKIHKLETEDNKKNY
jgi:hypothetical protein